MRKEKIETKYAESLGEYFSAVSEFATTNDNTEPDRLWFRGTDYSGYVLVPSLYRDMEWVELLNSKEEYSPARLSEDYRMQHYIAKNYHFFSHLPASRVEWMEVMQHHEMKTRLLDWSESATHSLVFAVEGFLNGKKYKASQRRSQFPCVWVLKPSKLNETIFRKLCEEPVLTKELARDLSMNCDEEKRFQEVLKELENSFNNNVIRTNMRHLEGVVNLSVIDDEIQSNRVRLKNMILNGEFFVIFYLLSRIYSDGVQMENRDLAPLAVVQPFHSERIKAQKGVFTVYPLYNDTENDKTLRKIGFEPNALQYRADVNQYLAKIELINPEGIAYELMASGINTSWLYPELPIIAGELEEHKIF